MCVGKGVKPAAILADLAFFCGCIYYILALFRVTAPLSRNFHNFLAWDHVTCGSQPTCGRNLDPPLEMDILIPRLRLSDKVLIKVVAGSLKNYLSVTVDRIPSFTCSHCLTASNISISICDLPQSIHQIEQMLVHDEELTSS